MNRRELLTGAAVLAGVTQANAFGIGKEGARFGHMGAVLGRAGVSTPYFNFNAGQFAVLSDAFIRVSGGTGRALGVHVGDSTSMGFDGGDGNTAMVNAKANCWPSIMANRLTTLGTQSNWENIAGTQGNANAVADSAFQTGGYKTGLNMGAAWTAQGTSTTFGGVLYTATAAGTFSYTPEIAVDNFELWDIVDTGLGTISYNIDGGADTNLVQAGTAASRRTVIPAGASGTHTLNIKWVSGTGYIGGVRAWNNAVKAFDFINGGRGSSTAADWAVSVSPYNSLPVLTNLAASADFVTIMLGENDEIQGKTESQFKTPYQTLINTAVAGGANVLLITPIPVSSGTVALATQALMRQWCKDLAVTNSLPLLDLFAYYGDWVAMNAAGLMFSGGHPNKAGYASIGTLVGNTINTWAATAAATAPVLSSASVPSYTGTTANLSVSTTKGNGTLYWVIDTSATPPSAAQVKLGQGSSGSAATSSGNQAVTVRGTQTKNGAAGLTNGVTYYAYFMHEDSGAHQSNVAASASFVPAGQVTVAYTDTASDNTAQTTYTWTSKAFAVGTADATRLVVVDVNARFGGTVITANSCTIGGVAATKVDEARNTTGGASTMTTRWQAAVPTGTTATVSTTYSGLVSRAGCVIVYTVVGSNGAAPTGTATANNVGTTTAVSASITVPANGKALISGDINQTGSTPSVTPTNYTTDLASTVVGTSTGRLAATTTPRALAPTRLLGASLPAQARPSLLRRGARRLPIAGSPLEVLWLKLPPGSNEGVSDCADPCCVENDDSGNNPIHAFPSAGEVCSSPLRSIQACGNVSGSVQVWKPSTSWGTARSLCGVTLRSRLPVAWTVHLAVSFLVHWRPHKCLPVEIPLICRHRIRNRIGHLL
jgi:lysophospholipase L1-like esterase